MRGGRETKLAQALAVALSCTHRWTLPAPQIRRSSRLMRQPFARDNPLTANLAVSIGTAALREQGMNEVEHGPLKRQIGKVKPLTVLITGFGAFPGVRLNPTLRLMRRISHSVGRGFHGVSASGTELTVRYSHAPRELAAADALALPDAMLLLGLAARARRVRVEQFARVLDSPLQRDASGASGASGSVPRSSGTMPLRATAQVGPALAALRSAGIAAGLSANAGRYLCNAVYAAALQQSAGRPVLFVHMPWPRAHPGTVPMGRSKGWQPSHARLAKALSRIAIMLALQARRTRLAQRGLA